MGSFGPASSSITRVWLSQCAEIRLADQAQWELRIGATTVYLSRLVAHNSPELALSLGYFLAVTRQRGR